MISKLADIQGKRVFVSGGAGVIGLTLVQKLHELGAIIFVGDLKPRPKHWPKDILYRQGDLNYITPQELIAFQPAYFIHLAATFERSTESYEFWKENEQHNVKLSTYLMGIMKDIISLRKVVFASSYLIYDKRLYCFEKPAEKAVTLHEETPIYPRNLTGAAKLNHEIELRFLGEFKREQFQTVSARIYRSYGKNSRDVISRWIRALLNNEELVVFKKEGIFDYIFAEEVAEGLILLALHPTASGVINLGRGNARRVTDLLAVLHNHFPDMKWREEEIDIPYEASQADMTLYERIIGWKPSRDIEDTIPEMILFEKNALHAKEVEGIVPHVLVTSISQKIPLLEALTRAAQKLSPAVKVIGGDLNPNCMGRHFVHKFWQMPYLKDENIPGILSYIEQHNIRAVIPTRDGELPFWAALSNVLEERGVRVMISSPEGIGNCLDKLIFSGVLPGMAIPSALKPEDLKGVDRFVVKEQFGAGSHSIGIDLTLHDAQQHALKLEHPIYQPYIDGVEYSVDMYITRSGTVKGVVCRTRDMVVNGESKITTTCRHEPLEALCIKAAGQLKLYGHVIFQAIVNPKGCHIIECNSRFGGASTAAIAAGLDSFYWFLLEASGEDLSSYPFDRTEKEIRQIRYSKDLISEV